MSPSFSSSKLIVTTSLLSFATGAILSVSENGNLQKTTGNCLPGMREFMREFDICKTGKTCFLFRQQSQFIAIPSAMKSVEDQRLFPCYKHHLVHPGLAGLSFDVLKRTSFLESKCAWVGSNCSYNQLVYFMAEKAKQGFRFTSLNALLESKRRLNISCVSTPFYRAKIAIIGPKDKAMPLEPIETLRRPFKGATWVFVTCILITFLVLYLWIEFRWPSVYNPFPSVAEELGKNSLTEGNDVEGYSCRALHSVRVQIIRRVLWGSLIMFVTICLILYEPAAVNFLFRQSRAKLSKNLASFSNKELALYGLERDQAVEDTFRELVDGGGRFPNRTYPWHRFTKIEDCWKTFLNSRGQVRYVVTIAEEAEYLVQHYGGRSKVASYELDIDNIGFSMGYLHNLAVPRNSVVQLDLDLMKLRTSYEFRKHIEERMALSIESKGNSDLDIGWRLLAIPCSIAVVPLLLFVLLHLIFLK